MLYITALIRPRAEHADAVGAALAALASASRSEEGCRAYEVFRRTNTPLFITHEIWTDREAEKAHLKGPHVAALVASVGDLLDGPPDIHRCEKLA